MSCSKGIKSDQPEPSSTFSIDVAQVEDMPMDVDGQAVGISAPVQNENNLEELRPSDVTRKKVNHIALWNLFL